MGPDWLQRRSHGPIACSGERARQGSCDVEVVSQRTRLFKFPGSLCVAVRESEQRSAEPLSYLADTRLRPEGAPDYESVHVRGVGGVIGSSIAYHAAKAGARVALVEPGSPRFPSASWASAGGVRRQNRVASEWALALAARRQWPRLEAELQSDCEFRAGGHLHAALDESTLAAFSRRAASESAAGLEVQVIDARAARQIASAAGLNAVVPPVRS